MNQPTAIRFGLVYAPTNGTWLGADNYFKNLIYAALHGSDGTLQPVLFTSHRKFSLPPEFQGAEIVGSPLFDATHPLFHLRRLFRRALKHDWFMKQVGRRHRIALLSHSGYIAKRSPLPALGWIPDFQHVHLPRFFTPAQIHERSSYFKRLCQYCQGIIVSSESSRRDLLEFFPQCKTPVYILRFVACLVKNDAPLSLDELRRKYGFEGPFFLLPNQFWTHKNHQVVLRALHQMKQSGKAPLVLATGNTRDHRQPDHFNGLTEMIRNLGIEGEFRVLGVVPYQDLASLMIHCVAIINPSYFEGWATSVEEAKSLGKQVLISDIDVHREQNPPRSQRFHPDQPGDLAALMGSVLREFSPEDDRRHQNQARQLLRDRLRQFAGEYRGILSSAVRSKEQG